MLTNITCFIIIIIIIIIIITNMLFYFHTISSAYDSYSPERKNSFHSHNSLTTLSASETHVLIVYRSFSVM
jgi:uncharacterized protein YpmB